MKIVDNFRNIFKIEELRNRILYTLGALMVFRLGGFITIPGVDANLLNPTTTNTSDIFGLIDLFVGGAFTRAGVFALGIMPYITASIIMQLMGIVLPSIQKLQREGDEGRRKLNRWTRYGTVLITIIQAIAFAITFWTQSRQAIVVSYSEFLFSSIVILTGGTIFLMWLGERITDRGIGNGISLLIMFGIIVALPVNLINEATTRANIIIFLIEIGIWILIVLGVVLLTQGTRKIPVHYARRIVGRKVYGGITQYIPLKVNAAGVMPIIFAQTLMFIPAIIAGLFPNSDIVSFLTSWANDIASIPYSIVFFLICVFFTFFYTAIAINPKEMADTLKRQGGFIPGVKPGKQTIAFLDNVLSRITLPGAILLSLVAIFPSIAIRLGVTPGFAIFYGGTSLLIIVGVALDTLQQIESHLIMRYYDGFMKTGKIKGRRK